MMTRLPFCGLLSRLESPSISRGPAAIVAWQYLFGHEGAVGYTGPCHPMNTAEDPLIEQGTAEMNMSLQSGGGFADT
jgi:hypothetical protein